MEQEFGCLHLRIGMKPALHYVIVEQVENRKQRHSLVVRHPFADKNGLPGWT